MATTSTTKMRQFLWALLAAVASSLAYLVVELLSQHDLGWAPIGMLGIIVVLTPIFYAINIRNARERLPRS